MPTAICRDANAISSDTHRDSRESCCRLGASSVSRPIFEMVSRCLKYSALVPLPKRLCTASQSMPSPSEIASTTCCRGVSFTRHLFDEPRQRASQRNTRRVGSRFAHDERQLLVAVAKFEAADDQRLILRFEPPQGRAIAFLLLRGDG